MQLRRIQPGVTQKAEWMAPEAVVLRVHSDYMSALEWLQDSALKTWLHQWTYAPLYLSGDCLRHHQQVLRQKREQPGPDCVGILRSAHHIEVRCFSEDGERCLVIDNQSQRRMATYDAVSHERIHTQDLGSCAVVYQMAYDLRTRRWKVDSFVQQLPLGWGDPKAARWLTLLTDLSASTGRDH